MYLFAHLKFSLLGAYSEPCEKFKIELYAETSSQRNEDFCSSFHEAASFAEYFQLLIQWNLPIADTYEVSASAIHGMSAIWDVRYWEVSL